jgi:membrane glycosyltransferase
MNSKIFTHNLGDIFISISIIIYSFVPIIADFNKTHATNPIWPSHARFHVVWQVMITFFLGILCLYLLWFNENYRYFRYNIILAISLSVLLSFHINAIFMKTYGGKLSDENGIKSIFKFDLNLIGFLIAIVFLIIGYFIALKG